MSVGAGALEGAGLGARGGSIVGAFFGPEGISIGAVIGGAGGAVVGGVAGWYGAEWLANHMSNADEKAEDKPDTDAGNADEVCSSCQIKDPCKGVRRQLEKHKQKLKDYINNPEAHDNLGLLGQGIDSDVMKRRVDSLQRQIASWQRELEKCEKANGTS